MNRTGLRRMNTDSPEFRALIERHHAFWNGEEQGSYLRTTGVFAPSEPIGLPQPDGRVIRHAERVTPDMIDPDCMVDELEHWSPDKLDATLLAQGHYLVSMGLGDVLPTTRPFSKVPWMEAMLGCPLKITEGQLWNEHYPGDPEEVIQRGANLEHNPWFQLYLEFLRRLPARIGDRFAVSANTLLRGTSDLAAAVMGVQEAAMGWIDDPKLMARLMRVCTDALLMVIEAGYQVLEPFAGGYPSYGILASAPVVSTQADHSTLISARMYEKQILPYDIEIIQSCPYSVLHLHNCGLHVAPLLVEVPELNVIEVALDPYPIDDERRVYELQMYQMILEHKSLILDANLPDLAECNWLLDNLPKRRLCMNAKFTPEVYATLPDDLPGRDNWILDGGATQ
jgi:hypothetical protein